MQRLFILSATPFLFDAGVAACLASGSHAAPSTCQVEAVRGYVVFSDWDRISVAGPGIPPLKPRRIALNPQQSG